ncbi:MAG: hypothetical protein NXH73_03025 [Flavobacteriaceae bacterium]|nr:hypothetical protein [Flavobacteriaceae bacterium]
MILLKKPIVLFIFTSAFAVYLMQYLSIQLPELINNYYNNLLCMPLVLTTCLIVLQFIKKNNRLTIPIFAIASVTLYYILYFEWYLPNVNKRYTSDPIDGVLYVIGAIGFYSMQKHG